MIKDNTVREAKLGLMPDLIIRGIRIFCSYNIWMVHCDLHFIRQSRPPTERSNQLEYSLNRILRQYASRCTSHTAYNARRSVALYSESDVEKKTKSVKTMLKAHSHMVVTYEEELWPGKVLEVKNNGAVVSCISYRFSKMVALIEDGNSQRYVAAAKNECGEEKENVFLHVPSLHVKTSIITIIIGCSRTSLVRASYKICEIIATASKLFTDGEFVKDWLIAERISEMRDNLEGQLIARMKTFTSYSLALNESTDRKDTAQLAVFMSAVDSDFNVHGDLVDVISLKYRT
ncbi:hypothetical protein ANN_14101 [Periplaneta americana]|uniref:Uncharacterized protein n=1 Tax=Periplaneta americana TaxID=6978 RepID=A0ABQ8SVF4_PERAM|nr:hypothetical protein ANN_14101 [Periplaneta americana]